jgi:hypothetical protein
MAAGTLPAFYYGCRDSKPFKMEEPRFQSIVFSHTVTDPEHMWPDNGGLFLTFFIPANSQCFMCHQTGFILPPPTRVNPQTGNLKTTF